MCRWMAGRKPSSALPRKVALARRRKKSSSCIHPPERVSQEVELSFRCLADACLLLVDRELQLAHDLAQSLQRLFGFAFLPDQEHRQNLAGSVIQCHDQIELRLLLQPGV